MEILHAATLDEFRAASDRLMTAEATYFRGQVTDYPRILPSAFRPGVVTTAGVGDLIAKLYVLAYAIVDWEAFQAQRDEEFARSLPDPVSGTSFTLPKEGFGFDASKIPTYETTARQSFFSYDIEDEMRLVEDSFRARWSVHSDALLQHYGVPSPTLDVTNDPLVALWFAANAFVRNADGTAVFAPTGGGTGVVYVFQRYDNSQVIDLQVSTRFDEIGFRGVDDVPYFGLRGIAQKGLLLQGATALEPDLRRHVTAQIHLAPGPWIQDALPGLGYDYTRMIPPPSVDRFYRTLLQERATATSEFQTVARQIIEYV